jgi:hypothetical protein
VLAAIFTIFFQISTSFWSYWGDGNAELNTYSVKQNRYGQARKAQVTLIYVTEPFNLKKQVKSDDSNIKDDYVINVLKLNRIKEFQTGIYDYNIMSSVFTPTESYRIKNIVFKQSDPIKISFSSQEWCGLVHHQLNREENGVRSISHSYFESEADTNQLLISDKQTIFADNLFISVRELLIPFQKGSIKLYPTLETIRLLHHPLEKSDAIVAVKEEKYLFNEKNVDVRKWKISSISESWLFFVEQNYPRRILSYEHTVDEQLVESGKLVNSKRLPYWKLNKNGNESYLEEMEIANKN